MAEKKKRKSKDDPEGFRQAVRQAQNFMNKISGAAMSTIEREKIRDSAPRRTNFPPRAKGSERSFAFESVDPSGRRTIRFSDKPKKKKGERLIQ
jgi:hypothetical protein